MNRTETPLARILKERILDQGSITFLDFMVQALFHPELGFYSKGPDIGSQGGTFNTSAMFPAFAFSLARAIEQAEALLGESLRIVEFGAGIGELGSRILSSLSSPHEYMVVETSPGLRCKQKGLGLQVVESVDALDSAPSFVFANEVVDALPVHRVMGDGQGNILEMYVTLDQRGEFVEEFREPSTPELISQLVREGIVLGRGHVAEVCLAMHPFIQEAASIMSKGYLVIIDYGEEASALYHYSRKNGSLRCYYQQQQVYDPFENIGDQDLTADVNFTTIDMAARSAGLEAAGSVWQGTWLKNLGIEEFQPKGISRKEALVQIDQLTNPTRLGSTFDVLAWKTHGIPNPPGFVTTQVE